MAAEAKLKTKGKSVRFDGVDIRTPRTKPGPSSRTVANPPPEEIVSPQVQASSSKGKAPAKPPTTPTNPTSASASTSSPSSASPSTSAPKPVQPQEKRNTTQYKYQFPLEDPEASNRVFEAMRDTTINLSIGDVLSVAPDVRKQLREQTTTKRVAVDCITMNVNELSGRNPRDIWGDYETSLERRDDGTIVARHAMPLRTITAKVNNSREVQCILDQGAEIIAMRKDIGRHSECPHVWTIL